MAPTAQRYWKPCARCHTLMGPWHPSMCRRRIYCSPRCAGTKQFNPRSSRTLQVLDLLNQHLSHRQVANIVGISHQRVTTILRRQRVLHPETPPT